MSAEFPLDVRRDEDEPEYREQDDMQHFVHHVCTEEVHVFAADAKEGEVCLCGEEKW